jgi:hypothetical protein
MFYLCGLNFKSNSSGRLPGLLYHCENFSPWVYRFRKSVLGWQNGSSGRGPEFHKKRKGKEISIIKLIRLIKSDSYEPMHR